MIDLKEYFILNKIDKNSKTFQVMMNKDGNIIVLELINNEYYVPQLSDLQLIKDQVYQDIEVCYTLQTPEENEFEDIEDIQEFEQGYSEKNLIKRSKNKFQTLAIISGIVVSVFVYKGIDNKFHLFDENSNSLESASTISATNEIREDDNTYLDSLEKVREIFNEIITKEDLIEIVHTKDWNDLDKDYMIELIDLLPEDQDLFMLRENLIKMEIESFSRQEALDIGFNDNGSFNFETGRIRYVNRPDDLDGTKGTFGHEGCHATTILKTIKDGYTIDISYSPYNHYLNEVVTELYTVSLEANPEEDMKKNIRSYAEYNKFFIGYIRYYGSEKMISFLKKGDIDGFVDFASKDFPDIREHVSLVFTCNYKDISVSEDQFDRLMQLTFDSFLKSEKLLLDENRFNKENFKWDSSFFSSSNNNFYDFLSKKAEQKEINLSAQKYALLYMDQMIASNIWRASAESSYDLIKIDSSDGDLIEGMVHLKNSVSQEEITLGSTTVLNHEIWIENDQDDINYYIITNFGEKYEVSQYPVKKEAINGTFIPSDLDVIKISLDELIQNSSSMSSDSEGYINLSKSVENYYNSNVQKQR